MLIKTVCRLVRPFSLTGQFLHHADDVILRPAAALMMQDFEGVAEITKADSRLFLGDRRALTHLVPLDLFCECQDDRQTTAFYRYHLYTKTCLLTSYPLRHSWYQY